MEWFRRARFDTWCIDTRATAARQVAPRINCDISNGADDLEAGSEYILKTTGQGAACLRHLLGG